MRAPHEHSARRGGGGHRRRDSCGHTGLGCRACSASATHDNGCWQQSRARQLALLTSACNATVFGTTRDPLEGVVCPSAGTSRQPQQHSRAAAARPQAVPRAAPLHVAPRMVMAAPWIGPRHATAATIARLFVVTFYSCFNAWAKTVSTARPRTTTLQHYFQFRRGVDACRVRCSAAACERIQRAFAVHNNGRCPNRCSSEAEAISE